MHMKNDRFPDSFQTDAPHYDCMSPKPHASVPKRHGRRATLLMFGGALALFFAVVPLFAVPMPQSMQKIVAAQINANAPSAAAATPVLIEVWPTAMPDAAAYVQISQYTELQMGDDYPAVQQLQNQLTALGYLDADEPSTVYNSALADAVSMFQRAHGMPIDGEADIELQDALFNSHALTYRVALGDEGDDVAYLQNGLASLGYFTGKATGYFGTATEAALIAFQQNNGMEPDGIFDADDRERMYSPDAVPATAPESSSATPTPTKRPAATAKPEPAKTSGEQEPAPAADFIPIAVESPAEPLATLPPEPVTEPAPAAETPLSEPTADPFDPLMGQLDGGTDAAEPTPDAPTDNGGASDSDIIESIVRTALAQLGKPYKRGAEGPNSYDCSGLVHYCLTQSGVNIGRYSAASYSKVGDWKKISSMSKLRRGDLIFYHDDDSSRVSHVGICLGDGTMVDASSNKSQIVHRSHSTAYWQRNFVCGRRIF